MSDPLLAPALRARLEALLAEHGYGVPDLEMVARLLRARGIAVVDAERTRHLVDETVYAGALFRLRQAEALLRPHRIVPPAVWLALSTVEGRAPAPRPQRPEDGDLAIPAFMRRAAA